MLAEFPRQFEHSAIENQSDNIHCPFDNGGAVPANAQMSLDPATEFRIKLSVKVLGNELMNRSAADFNDDQSILVNPALECAICSRVREKSMHL